MLQTVKASRGMVTASHHLASQAGLQILREGGNAIEAMVAAAATISVVYPHMNGLGGDGFWLISEPGRRVPRAISAVGAAGMAVDEELYRRQGLEVVPPRGALAANTVAGTVSGWMAALEISAEWGGSFSLARLLEEAIHYAQTGFAVTESQHRFTRDKRDELADVPGWADTFLLDRRAPAVGTRFTQPALANSLLCLSTNGLEDFYRGEIARRIANELARIGSPVTADDLARQRAHVGEPLTTRLRCGSVYNVPPPCQGLASLMILGLFDRLGCDEAEGFAHVHGLVEATKRAILTRNEHVTDPVYMTVDPRQFLNDATLTELAAGIERGKAMPWPVVGAPGDTVWLGAVDAQGRAVSFIHSIYWEFGSGVNLSDTGIQWQNRGSSFALNKHKQNYIRPGRLPFHTNNPAMAVFDDGRVMVYGAMGGEGQPQTQAAVFTRYALYEQGLQRAITAPRWVLSRTWGAPRTDLRMESRFENSVVDALREAGHEISMVEAFDDVMGHAGAIVLHPSTVLEGATDPRSDGAVAAF